MSGEGPRKFCIKLEHLCAVCLVCMYSKWRTLLQTKMRHLSNTSSCFGGRCVRCVQVGHNARTCSNMRVPNYQRGACRERFLKYAGCETLHSTNECGWKIFPFREIAHRLMCCWDTTSVQSVLKEFGIKHRLKREGNRRWKFHLVVLREPLWEICSYPGVLRTGRVHLSL